MIAKKKLPVLIAAVFLFILVAPLTSAQKKNSCRSKAGGYCVIIAGVEKNAEPKKILGFAAQVPGIEFLGIHENANIGDFLAALYIFMLGLVGIAALIMLVVGGVTYISAGDSKERFEHAKKIMGNAIFGLFIALIAYLILSTINPDLVKKLELKDLPKIRREKPSPRSVNFSGFCFVENRNYCSLTKCDETHACAGNTTCRPKEQCPNKDELP
jgi:hypothetical protein